MQHDDLDALPNGTVVYYKVFYDGWNHMLAQKLADKWYTVPQHSMFAEEAEIPIDVYPYHVNAQVVFDPRVDGSLL